MSVERMQHSGRSWQPNVEEERVLRACSVRFSDLERIESGCSLTTWAERHGSRILVRAFDEWSARRVVELWDRPGCIVETFVRCEHVADEFRFGDRERTVLAVLVIGREAVEKLLKKEDQMTNQNQKTEEQNIVSDLKARAKGALAEEIPTVAWMTAARAAIDRSAPQIGKVLVKAKVIRAPTGEMVTAFVKSDLGSGIYGFAAGTILSAHPRAAKKPWLGMIAKHMRMEGLARIGTVLVDPLLTAVERVLLGAVEESGIDVSEVEDR